MSSPYDLQRKKDWFAVTKKLILAHPLKQEILVKSVLESWESIFASGISDKQFRIGKDIFPSPQIMGFFLHELIPLTIKSIEKGKWEKGVNKDEKDLVCLFNSGYSVEIKTSSNKSKIFGNRSYGQKSTKSSKSKDGYYLSVNFEKFSESKEPKVRLIRFGWLDHFDWVSQKAPTGQQSRLTKEADSFKLIELYPHSNL